MLSVPFAAPQKHPARIKSRKSSFIPLAGVDFLTAFSKSLVSADDFIKPSRPYVRASILAAKREQGGKRPWR